MNANSRILVVDNSKPTLDIIEKYLEAEGYDTCSAENGAQALNLCMTIKPKVVTLALDLPIMDGFETLKRIRKEFPEINCIVISSLESMEVMERCFRFGAVGFLVKPFTKDELVYTIKNTIKPQAQGMLFHFFTRAASRLDNAMRKLIPNSAVALVTLEMFPYEVPIKINYQNVGSIVSIPKIKEIKKWSAPTGKIGFIDLLVGSTEGKIISFIDEKAMFRLRNFEGVIGDIEEFFDMVHAKIASELAESFERQLHLKRCGHFDEQTFEAPPIDLHKTEFVFTINKEQIKLDTFVWLPN